ncbi:MAG: IS3 family transposase [Planctomycetaceae bacterium]
MTDVYAAVDQLVIREEFSVSVICDVLEVSRSGISAWRSRQESQRELRDQELTPISQEIFWHHKRRYGARRIAAELSRRDIACGVARVARLLKTQGLAALQPKSFQPKTTQSRHGLGYNPNLLASREAPQTINEVWVGDITYIRLRTGRFGYLSLLLDLFSRRIVGWEYGPLMNEDLVLESLRRAIVERQPPADLIHHTDRGGQYASTRYRAVLRRAGMSQSMSGAGNCYDNAVMESCFGTIKTELQLVDYADHLEAHRELISYVPYYNSVSDYALVLCAWKIEVLLFRVWYRGPFSMTAFRSLLNGLSGGCIKVGATEYPRAVG